MKKLWLKWTLATVALTAGWYLLLMSPLKNEENRVASARAEVETNIADYEKKLLEFPEFYRAEKEILEKRKVLISQLYSKEDLIKLFRRFEENAMRFRLNLLEITPSIEELLKLNKLSEDGQPQQLNMMVRLSGDFPALGSFVRTIEEEKFYQGANFCRVTSIGQGEAFPEMTFGFKAVLGALREG